MALLHGALTKSVIEAYHDSYDYLGSGFLESTCCRALEIELLARGHTVAREVAVAVRYKGHDLGTQRIDMIVDDRLIVEVKAAADLHESAVRQLTGYLRATRLELGLVINYGPRPSFRRVIFSNAYKRACLGEDTTRGDR